MNAYADVQPIQGGSLTPGKAYHDIPGEPGPTFRQGSQDRADHIATLIDVDGKHGLDLGCSVGGISFGLEQHGAVMTGVDYDPSSIETALQVAERRQSTCAFMVADLTADRTWGWLSGEGFDFAVWLSNWMWIAAQAGHEQAAVRLHQLSLAVPTLVFETAQGPGDGMAGTSEVVGPDGVRALLEANTVYDDIEAHRPVNRWCGNRTVFVCRR